jgi:hypothetical protein
MFCVFVTAPHSCGALFFYAIGQAWIENQKIKDI